MSKIDLKLDYDAIRSRIELDKNKHKRGAWAKNVGVSSAIITNVHGKSKQKPSMEYIIAIARYTGKSIENYLWGNKATLDKRTFEKEVTKPPYPELLELFNQNELALKINQGLLKLRMIDKKELKKVYEFVEYRLHKKQKDLKNIPDETKIKADKFDKTSDMAKV